METKEKFKDFVKNNPILLKYVKENKMTWQQFYEIYDLYGEDKEAWKYFTAVYWKDNTIRESISEEDFYEISL